MDLVPTEAQFPLRLRFETPLSDWDLERFSNDNNPMRVEREPNGELTVMSHTGFEGGGQEGNVLFELMTWARQDGRGRAFGPNAGVILPDTSVRAADAAWVSYARWNALTPEERKGFAPLCPECVIELRFHSDRLSPLQAKMEQWIANGAELAWLIDPLEKTVTIYRPNEAPEHHYDPTSVQGTGPVHGFELIMDRIWNDSAQEPRS